MSKEKFLNYSGLSNFLNNLSKKFASLLHTHTMSDISDLEIDSSLSSTSTNPVQNAVIKVELDTVKEEINTIKDAQSDWEQNDETAIDYVKNRPFYEDYGTVEILPETTVGGYNQTISFSSSFVTGNTYTVIYNGEEYTCVADNGRIGNYTGFIVDDYSAGTGEPFYFSSSGAVDNGSASYPYTVAIYTIDTIIKQIDSKFIPDTIQRANLVVTIADGDSSHSASEIYEAVQNNILVIAIDKDTTNERYQFIKYQFSNAYFAYSLGDTIRTIEIDEDKNVTTSITDISNKLRSYETTTDAQTKYENAIAHSDSNLETAKAYVDTVASGKADSDHNHDEDYDAIGSADAALASSKSYTDTKTSSLASTSSVTSAINTHDTSTSAHNDIRILLSDISTKLNNFLDIDDTTKDQLSEVIALIEENQDLIEGITTSKVSVSDIIDNLTTNSSSKVLSAAQGIVIKGLIDALQTEVNSKADSEHTHAISDVTNLQSTLDGKQATITGGASTITDSNLTTNRALISNSNGKVAVSDVTSTQLGYLSGATSNIQTQLDSKANSSVLSSYYTKDQIDAMEFITVDDIDTICGSSIVAASEVTF